MLKRTHAHSLTQISCRNGNLKNLIYPAVKAGNEKKPNTKNNSMSAKRRKKKNIKDFSSKELTKDEINPLTKGLKFIPTPVTKEIQIYKQQLLHNFEQFARRITLHVPRGGKRTSSIPC